MSAITNYFEKNYSISFVTAVRGIQFTQTLNFFSTVTSNVIRLSAKSEACVQSFLIISLYISTRKQTITISQITRRMADTVLVFTEKQGSSV